MYKDVSSSFPCSAVSSVYFCASCEWGIYILTHLHASNCLVEEKKSPTEEWAVFVCAQAVICVLLPVWVMWLTLPLLCTENTAERKPILCSLVINPLTFTSDCLADILVRELVVVTQRSLQSLHAEECCCYSLGCRLGSVTEECKLQRFLQQCSSSVGYGCCCLAWLLWTAL